MPLDHEAAKSGRIEPQALNETNMLELFVFASDEHGQAVLVARLDNLGKGASGAAMQNMRLMLGIRSHAPVAARAVSVTASHCHVTAPPVGAAFSPGLVT